MKCDVFDKNPIDGRKTFIGSVEIDEKTKRFILYRGSIAFQSSHDQKSETFWGGCNFSTSKQKKSIQALKRFTRGRTILWTNDLGNRIEFYLNEKDCKDETL